MFLDLLIKIIFETHFQCVLYFSIQFKGTALEEKLLEAGVNLLTKELNSRVKTKEQEKKSDSGSKVLITFESNKIIYTLLVTLL